MQEKFSIVNHSLDVTAGWVIPSSIFAVHKFKFSIPIRSYNFLWIE